MRVLRSRMTLHDVLNIVDGTLLSARAELALPVRAFYAADLMSDVLAFAAPDSVLLTGLCNPQVLRTARMADCAAVILAGGKVPTTEMQALADELAIPLVRARLSMFEMCGRLYAEMNRLSAPGAS